MSLEVVVEVIRIEAEEVISRGKMNGTSKMANPKSGLSKIASQNNGPSKTANQKNGIIIVKKVRKKNGKTNVREVVTENLTTTKIISRET
jgi:hypothetical protein